MGAFMDKLMGRGSISNASPMGGGGDAPVFTPPTGAAPSLSVGAPVGDNSAALSPPSRPESGKPGVPAKANVASGRYGAELPEGAGVQRKAAGSASAIQGAPAEGANSSAAATTDPVTVTPANSASGDAAGASGTAQESPAGQTDPGSARTAGISGKSNLESDLSKLVEHLTSQQQGPRKPTLGERLGEANRHVSQEQAATHVSINSHHAD